MSRRNRKFTEEDFKRQEEEKKRKNPNKKNVHFKDEIEGNNLCDVIIIESFKQYYNTVNQSTCTCTCSIY